MIDLLLLEGTGRVRPRQMSLRKERTWTRIEKLQAEIDEVLDRLGKQETISVAKIVELNNSKKVPTMIKHGVVAIYDSLKKRTDENIAQRYIGAHNIAYHVFRKYGYIKANGFGMTGKGVVRNMMHEKNEPGVGGKKTNRYGKLYNMIMKRKKTYKTKDSFRHQTHPKIKSVTSGGSHKKGSA